jgi:uncharacterized membrane protein YdjX (TVP38/TMEM64 family)
MPEDSAANGAPGARPPLRQLIRDCGPVGVLAVLWTALPPVCSIALFTYMPTISAYLKSHEGSGPFIYSGAFAVLAGIGCLPTYAQSGLGGYAFGWQVGIPAALAGFAGAAVIGYGIARAVSGERVARLIQADPRARAVRDALVRDRDAGGGFWSTLGMVALLRSPPNSPFSLGNLAMAAAKVPFWPFVLGTVIGMAPRTAVAVVIGSLVAGALTKESLDQAAPRWVWIAAIIISVAIFLLIGWIAQRAVNKVTARSMPATANE